MPKRNAPPNAAAKHAAASTKMHPAHECIHSTLQLRRCRKGTAAPPTSNCMLKVRRILERQRRDIMQQAPRRTLRTSTYTQSCSCGDAEKAQPRHQRAPACSNATLHRNAAARHLAARRILRTSACTNAHARPSWPPPAYLTTAAAPPSKLLKISSSRPLCEHAFCLLLQHLRNNQTRSYLKCSASDSNEASTPKGEKKKLPFWSHSW
jgi:hypothetical protein